MLEHILQHWKYLLRILIIIIISIVIYSFIISKSLKNYILNNWNYYKNKSYIIPFSGFIKKNPGMTTTQTTTHNFITVLWLTVKKILLFLIKPIYPFLRLIIKVIDYIKNILDNFRIQFKIMRNFLFKMIENIYTRLQNSVAAITYFFLKLRDGLKKQIGLFKILSWTVAHSYYFLYSLVKGPIGTFGKFGEKWGLAASVFTLGIPGAATWFSSVCFDPTTPIKLINNKIVKLEDIKINDILLDNNTVQSVLIFNIENNIVPMFNYKNTIVSGDHIVLENNKFIRIKESHLSKPILYKKNKLICLVTEKGNININGLLFKDYLDTHNISINHKIHRIIENSLNSKPLDSYKRIPDLLWGFSKNTVVNYKGNRIILKDIKMGDIILGSRVTGIIHICKNILTSYEYSRNTFKIYVSGNQLVKEDNKWIRVSQSNYSKKIQPINIDYVNFTTENNLISINNILFRDFIETNDINIIESINNLVDLGQKNRHTLI